MLYADSDEYHQYAAGLVRDHAYYFDYKGPMAAWKGLRFRSSRSPGYPFFIAAIYVVTGPVPRAVLVVQALLDTITVFMVYLLGMRLFSRDGPSLVAAGLYGLIAYRVGMVMSEVLSAAFLAWLLLILCGIDLGNKRRALIGGLVFGGLVLTRPLFIILAPLIALWYLKKLGRGKALKTLVFFGAATTVLIGPWIVRDFMVHNRFVFLATIGGRTFHQGSYIPIDGHDIYLAARRRGMDEVSADHLLYRVTIDYLMEHPMHQGKAMFKRLVTLWTPFMEGGDEKKYFFNPLLKDGAGLSMVVVGAGFLAYLASRTVSYLALVAMMIHRRRARDLLPLFALPVWLSLFHFLLFLGLPRYLAPAYPVFCLLSAMIFTMNRSSTEVAGD